MSFKYINESFDFMQVAYAVTKESFFNYAFIEVFTMIHRNV